jgi:tRNA pseudouridine38-40 synthase
LPVPRYKLTIAYDGTDFCGWQKQEPPAGRDIAPEKVMDEKPGEADARLVLRTVQEVVERACREVVREPVVVMGASRTDSGVHARGQVAAFTCSDQGQTGWPVERGAEPLVRALNSRLPHDVLVVDAAPVAETFDPISDCTAKGYSYTLHVSPHRPLFDRWFVHHVWVPLDVPAMNTAAARLVGEHDFAAFAAAGHGRMSTVRTVYECRVEETETARQPGIEPAKRVRIEVSGNGFLWNMVRIIAGTLVDVGRSRLTPDDVSAAITSGDRRKAGPTMPAEGLCLEWVRYD